MIAFAVIAGVLACWGLWVEVRGVLLRRRERRQIRDWFSRGLD